MIVKKEDLAMFFGIASMAIEFCRKPETYPVFAEWLANEDSAHEGINSPVIPIAQLEVADIIITAYSDKLFKESHDEAARGTRSSGSGTGADAGDEYEEAK